MLHQIFISKAEYANFHQVMQSMPKLRKVKHSMPIFHQVKQSMPIFCQVRQSMHLIYQTKQHDKKKFKKYNLTFFSDLFSSESAYKFTT